MTFEQWWATLTDAEHRVIGKHNARYVWDEASKQVADEIFAMVKEGGWGWDSEGMREHWDKRGKE
jgi:hypothetical protein